ncbi:MAG: Guanyl-specific ribonuclease [uncultured Nocardioides sp.]|uniref:Guanyl-specific ribonuclease n=1 Tax=uncultured Nocardioides sp. TaxID=198441 RepID=A0A6J4N9Y1_9ACTN|nr:MAG: Guanyl-specific ribonuclease [uncultured Nocardioides sp.]
MAIENAPRRTGQRNLVGLVIALVTTAVIWWTAGQQTDQDVEPSSGGTTSAESSRADAGTGEPSPAGTDPASGLAVVALADLPPEAEETVALIDTGGPFPHDEDDGVFGNFEGILPDEQRGYYREYTVETPGLDHRGARRIVTGSSGELYWTDDHYSSFARIAR